MGTTNFTVRLDDVDRTMAEEVFERLGLTMSAGINVYVKTVARLRKIPFELSLETEPQLANRPKQVEKEKSARALIGLLAGHEVDLEREREERVLG
jgi:DNA-damage-inducible protein J